MLLCVPGAGVSVCATDSIPLCDHVTICTFYSGQTVSYIQSGTVLNRVPRDILRHRFCRSHCAFFNRVG